MKNKGFTLIGLTIVIAIIGILTSMFAPYLYRYFAERPSKPVTTNSQGLR